MLIFRIYFEFEHHISPFSAIKKAHNHKKTKKFVYHILTTFLKLNRLSEVKIVVRYLKLSL